MGGVHRFSVLSQKYDYHLRWRFHRETVVGEARCVSANRHRCALPPRNLHRPKGFGRNGAVFVVAPPRNE